MKNNIILVLIISLFFGSITIGAASADVKEFKFEIAGTWAEWTPKSKKYYTGNSKNRDKSAYVLNTLENTGSKHKFYLKHQMYSIDGKKTFSNVWRMKPNYRTDFANNAKSGSYYKLNVRRENWYENAAYANGSWSADNGRY